MRKKGISEWKKTYRRFRRHIRLYNKEQRMKICRLRMLAVTNKHKVYRGLKRHLRITGIRKYIHLSKF